MAFLRFSLAVCIALPALTPSSLLANAGQDSNFALLYSGRPIGEAVKDIPCTGITVADGHPTQQEWNRAIGRSSEVRFVQAQDSTTWVVAYEPQWTPDALLARPKPRPGRCLLCPGASAPFDTVRVAWENIVSLERHTRGISGRGAFVGALVGSWVAAPLVVLCAADYGCSGEEALLALLIVPASAIAGGLIAGSARWTPILCDGGSDGAHSDSAEP